MIRSVAIGALVLCASLAVSSAVPDPHTRTLHPAAAPGHGQLYVVGVRGLSSKGAVPGESNLGKLDGMLADLVRHASRVRPGHALADLHALSPGARFARAPASGTPLIAIDAVTRGDPAALESALVGLGLRQAAQYRNDVGGLLPVDQLANAAALTGLTSIRAAMVRRRATTGPVATQGDFVQQSDVVRTEFPALTGAGVKVGVISDSFDCYSAYAAPGSNVPVSGPQGYASNGFTADYASDVSTGALPAGVDVLVNGEPQFTGTAACFGYESLDSDNQPTGLPFSDEGRAMLQIVHAVAPGASLLFRTGAISEADFAKGIQALATAGAQVIAEDLQYYDEPFFQDGLLAQAVDSVKADGVAYFSAAGNNQETPAYVNTAPAFKTLASSGSNSGEYLLNFDATGATTVTSLPVTIPPLFPGDFVAVIVEWDQPYVTGSPSSGGATSQIDLCISGASGSDVILNYDNDVTSCSGVNAIGSDPYQIMLIQNVSSATSNTAQVTLNIQVGLANGTPAPGRIILAVDDDGQGSTINKFSPSGPTLQGHPGAAGAAAVGAAFYFDTPRCGTTPATLESYSGAGGNPILFDTSGTRLAAPIVRLKPDFVGPDGVNNTFLGFTLASQGPPQYPANGLLTTSIPECQNNPSYPNFFGSSAATPHAAGIAALMLQANSALKPDEIYSALRASALPMAVTKSIASCATAEPNYCAGYGFIQAPTALVAPALSLSAAGAAPGASVTVTWASANATSCTASGAWSGTLSGSGTKTVTAASTTGSETFALSCSDSAGNTASNSIGLNVGTPPAAPTLTLAQTSIVSGSSTTITWSAPGATSCTASGSWSGALATSGSETIAPTVAGTDTYTLTCSNDIGASPATSVTLTVTAKPSTGGGGGGGALGGLSLLGLAALAGGTRLRRERASGPPRGP